VADLGFNIPDDYLRDLLGADFDELAPEMLDEVLPILEQSIRRHLTGVIHNGSGELAGSISVTRPKKTKTDAWIANTYIKGQSKKHYYGSTTHNRQYAVSNALKAIWLNYGNAHQAARPWLTPAVNACEAEIMDKMQKKWEEITGANE
jgi:hypothetical protein